MSSTNSTHSSTPPNKPPPPIPTLAPAGGDKPALPAHHPARPKSCVVTGSNKVSSVRSPCKNTGSKVIVRRVTYFTLSQLRRWRTDQTRRWLLADTGGKIPFQIGSQIVIPRPTEGNNVVPGEWLCSLTKEKAMEVGIPEKNAEGLINSIHNFERKCAAVSIQRWSRKMLGKMEIQRIQKMDKHRMNVAKELLATEETYLEQLGIMCNLLYKPLTTEKKYQHVLTPDEIRTIFSDIEVISAVNTSLFDTLKDRIGNWTNHTKIGDVFVCMSAHFRVYLDYVKGYAQALKLVSSMSESHPFRKFFLDQIKLAPPQYANFNFESLLIVPIQRIPRYKMLLMDMLKNMRPEHPDYKGLGDALAEVGKIADWVNENQRKAESMAKTVELSERVVGMDEQLIAPNRVFIKEGLVMEAQVQNPQPRTLLLFSDILVVCEVKKVDTGSLLKKKKDKMQFHQKFRLCQMNVAESAPCAGFEHCFRVWKTGDDMGGLVYSALNDEEASEWVKELDKAIKEATDNQKKKEEELNKVATSKAEQAAAILSQQYASIRYGGSARSRLHGRGDSTLSNACAAGNIAAGAGTEGSESASDASLNVGGRSAHSRLSSTSSTSRKQTTWFSMNAAEKWRIVEEAKAELDNLRHLSEIEEALQKQRAQEQAERNKALLHSKYASINLGGDGESGPVAQRFTFGRRSLVGPSGSDSEKRRSMLVSDSGSASGSNDDDDVVFDDASSYAPSESSSSPSLSSTTAPVVVTANAAAIAAAAAAAVAAAKNDAKETKSDGEN